MSNSSSKAASVRYQPDESPPAALAFGCGVQLVLLGGASIVLIPTIVVRAAGGSEAYLSWAVFGVVAISGVCTALQAVRVGRIGAGYVLAMGPPGAFIGLSAAALAQGGPALLGSLVVAIVVAADRALRAALPVPAAPDADHRRHGEHADTGHRAAGRPTAACTRRRTRCRRWARR